MYTFLVLSQQKINQQHNNDDNNDNDNNESKGKIIQLTNKTKQLYWAKLLLY